MRSLWDSRSILSGLCNLYELRLVRFHKAKEWSPWNTILLSKDEAEIHNQLDNLHKVLIEGFDVLLIQPPTVLLTILF